MSGRRGNKQNWRAFLSRFCHGHIPRTCTIITLDSMAGKRNVVRFRNTTFEYSRIADSLFPGFELMSEGYSMALPGKALMDVLYLRREIPFEL